MNTKLLMAGSTIVMGAAGVAASFLPQEILLSINVDPVGATPLLVQIVGAAYLAFAMMNWMSKANLIGGIYNRPIAMANMLHFIIGALAILKGARDGQSIVLWIIAGVYSIFAVLFGKVFFTHPIEESGEKDESNRM